MLSLKNYQVKYNYRLKNVLINTWKGEIKREKKNAKIKL